MELPGMKSEDKTITFTRNEWKYFLDELKMRGTDKIAQCVNNARYLDKLDRADEQFTKGAGKFFTWKELDDYINAECMVSR